MLSGFCPASFWVLFCSVVLMFECDFAHHRRSVAVLCMLCKIRCNPMHPLYGALPQPYVLLHVTRSTVIAHRYTYAPPCCRTRSTAGLFSRQYLCGTILVTQYSMVRTTGFHEQGQFRFIGLAAGSLFVSYSFPFFFFHSMRWYCGAAVFSLVGC